jgi:hypothetical protein
MENGSITSIHYFAVGSPELPKEYIELYTNGSSIIIDDFARMTIYRNNAKRTIKLKKQDKGHKNHLL